MKEQIKKYAILNIVAKLLTNLIPAILILIFPKLLTFEFPTGGYKTYSLGYLTTPISYIFNIIIATFIFRDMRKLNIQSIPILILTCLSGVTGTTIFLFISFQNKLSKYEKQSN